MRYWLIALVLASVYLIVYRTAFSAGYVYEDRAFVETQTITSIAGQLSLGPRSLPRATFAWQADASPAAHHAVNIALNALVAALVWLWAWKSVRSTGAALAASALILLHPLAVESTAYVSSPSELIAAVFVMTACCFALTGLTSWSALAWAATIAAVSGIAKETAWLSCLFVAATYVAYRRVWRAPRGGGGPPGLPPGGCAVF